MGLEVIRANDVLPRQDPAFFALHSLPRAKQGPKSVIYTSLHFLTHTSVIYIIESYFTVIFPALPICMFSSSNESYVLVSPVLSSCGSDAFTS